MALAELAHRVSATFKSHKANATVAEARLSPGGPKLILAKPNSFMNLSGGPIAALLRFYDLDASRLIVLHDELDIPFDSVRLKSGGGHGGHNGVRSLLADLGQADFARVRVGVGRPATGRDPADYLLSNFSRAEDKELPALVGSAADAIEMIVAKGLPAAMNRFNGKAQSNKEPGNRA